MNKIIRPFVLASAFLVAIGVAPPPLISGINTAHAQTDTTAPTAAFSDVDNGVIGTEQSVLLTFSEAVTDLTASDFSTSAGVTGIRVSDPDSDQTTYTIAFTPSSQAIVLRLAANSVMDTAAIPNEGPVRLVEQALRATDPAMPSLVGTYASIAAGEINTRQMLTFTFSEPVTGLTVDAFTIGGGEVNSITPSSGYHTTYTLTLTPTTTGQVVLRLLANSVTDRDGNTGPGIPATLTTFSLGAPDTTAPTVDFGTIDVGVIGTRQTHTIRFNQIVTGFAATDITATGATVDGVSGSGDTYMITFTPTLTSFTLTLAADSVSDTAATPNTGPAAEPAAARSVSGSAVLSADADLATLSITDNNGNPVTPNEAIAPDTLTYTATAPSDTTSVTITVTAADSNAEVDLDSLGTNTENFGFRDEMQSFAIEITAADGTTRKLYRLTITRAVSLDTTAPTATFGTIDVGVIGTQQTVGITFDEAVTGLEAGDFSGSTDVTVDSVTGSGDTWTITFTPSETSFTLTLAANSVEDTAATPNAGPASAASVTGSATPATVTDMTAPTATFGTIIAGVIDRQQTVSLTFSEAVTGLAADDFSATGATVDGVSGSGDTWSITFTPTAASFTLTLAADSVSDTAATPNTGPETAESVTGTATPATVPDMTAPTATFGTIIAGVIDRQQTVSLTFDEAVTGLTAADITATGATVDSVSGSGDPWTITFTPSETSFTLTLAADSVEDLAATPNTGPETAASVSGSAAPAPSEPTEPDEDEEEKAKAAEAAIAEVILPAVVRVVADQSISAIAGRVERARTQPSGSGFNFAGQQMSFGGNANGGANAGNSMSSTLAGMMNSHGQSLADGTLDMKSLLGNSEFTMPLNAIGGTGSGTGSGTTFWGSGDYRNIDGESKDLDWDGDLFSLHLGVDAHITAEAIGGVALSWSEGEMDYDDDPTTGTGKKTYDTSMVSINPYLSWGNEYGEAWMTAGYGEGELEGEDANGGNKTTNDLSMQTFAIGGNRILLQRGADTLRVKGEVSQSMLEVDESKNGGLSEMEVDANRARLSLESTNTVTRDNGARIDRKVELGIRHDGGDGTTGSGIELGLGLRHVNASGLSTEGNLRALLGHEGDINEWGVSGTIKQSAGADGQGFSFALSPGYGDDSSDLQRLWEHGLRDVDGNASSDAADPDGNADPDTARTRAYSARLDARIGYGVNGFTAPSWLGSGSGLLTPYTSMTLSDDSNRYRLGVQWKLGEHLDFDLLGEREDATNADDNKILLKGELRF